MGKGRMYDDITCINRMAWCRSWIDPMLERELTDAEKSDNTVWAVRLSGALLPTHPEKLNYLYSALLPGKHHSGYRAHYMPSQENIYAELFLSVYDPAYATRMWEIAADNSRGVWQRYYAASRLAKIDPLNNKWDGIALEIIAHHDFAKDPNLSFGTVGMIGELDAQIKERFKNSLLKKIQKCSESSCPVMLLGDVLTPREALGMIAEGYLNGQFSWQGIEEKERRINQLNIESGYGYFRGFFDKETTDSERERRRQRALLWLKNTPNLWREH